MSHRLFWWAKQNALRLNMPTYGTGKDKEKNTVLIIKSHLSFICFSLFRAVNSKRRLRVSAGGEKAARCKCSLCWLCGEQRGRGRAHHCHWGAEPEGAGTSLDRWEEGEEGEWHGAASESQHPLVQGTFTLVWLKAELHSQPWQRTGCIYSPD